MHTDVDRDLLSDFCEKNLAAAFAPELATTESDETGGEPKWVAKPLDESRVRIAYLLSYHVDYGPVVSCVVPDAVEFFFGQEACQGHFGDSEMIVLEVYYHPVTQHWLLDRAIYSAHKNYNTYSRGSSAYPTALYYPAKAGGYPRAYVAYSKHANYASDSECDSGGPLNADECLADTYARVPAGAQLNLASRNVHTLQQDCMNSSNPIYSGNGVQECYWTVRRFGGWTGGQPNATDYSSRLADWGF